MLECSLATGRTHQIRVHLQSIGHPLVGDPVYRRSAPMADADSAKGFARQALHAQRLSFLHPFSGSRVSCHAELPADMRELIDNLD